MLLLMWIKMDFYLLTCSFWMFKSLALVCCRCPSVLVPHNCSDLCTFPCFLSWNPWRKNKISVERLGSSCWSCRPRSDCKKRFIITECDGFIKCTANKTVNVYLVKQLNILNGLCYLLLSELFCLKKKIRKKYKKTGQI